MFPSADGKSLPLSMRGLEGDRGHRDHRGKPVCIRGPSMEPENRHPVYRLQTVVRETGIRPDTLRVWERRYGLPRPLRTPGGHRLYSRRDIETIRWLMARQAEGMRIGEAVALWRALEAAGQDPLRARGAEAPQTGPASIEALRQAWVAAVLRFDEAEAERVWAQAVALYPVERVCRDLALGGIMEIGDRWYTGRATVQQEHFASALVARRLHALIAAAPPPSRTERILIACPPHEDHTLPSLLLTCLLRRQGWPVVDLGADVPMLRMEEALEAIGPHLVLMTAQTLFTAATLADMAEWLGRRGLRFGFGGGIFQRQPAARRYIAGHYLGDRWEDIPARVAAIWMGPAPDPAPELPVPYRGALERYRELHPVVEAEVARRAGEAARRIAALDLGSVGVGRVLEAALRLGEVELARAELRWLAGMLLHHGIPLAVWQALLRAYQAALEETARGIEPLERMAALLGEEAEGEG